MKQAQRMMAQMFNLLPGHRQFARVEDMNPEIDERDEEEQVQRRNNVRANQ